MRCTLCLALLLAACGPEQPMTMTNGAAAPAPGTTDRRIRCVLRDMTPAEQSCSVEEAVGPSGTVMILRRPDGGFRRLLRTRTAPYFVAADGAEQPNVVSIPDGRTAVHLGGDVYWLD